VSKELKIGVVITGAIVLFIYGFNFLKGHDLFSPKNEYKGKFTSAEGLVEANPVILNGMKVGLISEIKLDPLSPDSILMKFTLDEAISVYDSTKITIISSDLLGSKALEIQLGRKDDRGNKLLSGALLISEIETGIQEEVKKELAPLKHKIEDLLSGLEEVTLVIQQVLNEDVRKNITSSMERIPFAIKNLESATIKIDTLVSDQSDKLTSIFSNVEAISYNLRKSNDDIRRLIANTADLSDTLVQTDLRNAISNANKAMYQSSEIMRKINEGEGSMGLLLNNSSLYDGITASSENMSALLQDLKDNPHKYMHISLIDFHKK
jgi:phospholipid/cholesterol/gamma-HCH transport system substrate-binding protein